MKKSFLIILKCLFILGILSAQNGEIYQLGDSNNFVAGDFNNQVKVYKARQESQNWCWAACVQMVLKNQGLYLDQCEIVMEAFEQSECNDRPADCYTIEEVAGGWNINGQRIKSYVNEDMSPHDLINDLAFKYPLIIGLYMPGQSIGHAYVLTAVYFQYDNRNRKVPYKVVLRDPWPSNPSRLELDWDDFEDRIICITHVTF